MRTAALLLTALLLAGCGGTDEPAADRPEPAGDRTPSASGSGDTPAADPVDRFLEVTARHVCDVQGRIYDTPEDLAEAYEKAPDYPGLDAAVVTRLQRRLESDADFSRELNERVSQACG